MPRSHGLHSVWLTVAEFTLYEHQKKGVDFFISNRAGVLGDEMGLGKTLQAIVACQHFLQKGLIDEVLIVCPRSLKLNWCYEIRKFTATRECDIVIVEGDRNKRQLQLFTPRRWLIINYESLRIESSQMLEIFKARRFAMVCDESHKIKNMQAKQSQSCIELGRYATRKYLLSGTFVANKPEDVWNQVNFLDAGRLLGTFRDFKRRYCIERTLKYGYRYVNKIVNYKNLDELKAKLDRVMLRRTKAQCLDLPERVVKKIPVSMTAPQERFYRKICEGIVMSLQQPEQSLSLDNILTKMLYALAVAANPALVDPNLQVERLHARLAAQPRDTHAKRQLKFWQKLQPLPAKESGKLMALDDLLETYCLEEERKVIVWSFFVKNIELFAERYASYSPVTYYGKTSSAQRDHALWRFNNDHTCRLFIGNPQAAGLGLTLTSSSICIFYDRNFSTVDYQQAVDRIHRIGQTEICNVLILQAQASIDQHVDYLLEQKNKLINFLQERTQEEQDLDIDMVKKMLGWVTGGMAEKIGQPRTKGIT